ncbi:NAD(P)H-dependent oxidoreductase [Mycobacterium sp. CBMA271]|uniref:FMN-dependent NADH-azoreductase n=1 Tax=unclassified Mycobacteroides TaxID=2618759 RepID=UPI0012DD1648|nr:MULTISPECIES: NAD(P)H-dependent oxidoreductase [unclassified Mycobacteroides]MUM17146.1 FMN-dependent NADH-azoreductase [Mycobacteroides sp. CBMA 326]MUM23816.1 NAD(P)H-dependent oxidoreductase [Mycobacteroides sp. CBMA 271]
MKTLWVEASPNGENSLSSALAAEFIDAADPSATGDVERFNLWNSEFPQFGAEAATAKLAPMFGKDLTANQVQIWQDIVDEVERVRRFDRIVISSPMWNWNVPYPLKAWIDVIVQPRLSFSLDENGTHIGVLGNGKPVHLILTRSSAYDGRSPELLDFQQPYLEYVFTMLGYTVDSLVFEPTTRWSDEARQRFREKSLHRAREHGATITPTGN